MEYLSGAGRWTHTMGKSYTEIEYIDRFVGFICVCISRILSLSPRACMGAWYVHFSHFLPILPASDECAWAHVRVCVCMIIALLCCARCSARIAIETHNACVLYYSNEKSDSKHHSVKQWLLLAAMETEREKAVMNVRAFIWLDPRTGLKEKNNNEMVW